MIMARKNKPLPILEHIKITDFAAEGKSLARVDDMVVFVPWAVPGDVVDLQVRRKKHSYTSFQLCFLPPLGRLEGPIPLHGLRSGKESPCQCRRRGFNL